MTQCVTDNIVQHNLNESLVGVHLCITIRACQHQASQIKLTIEFVVLADGPQQFRDSKRFLALPLPCLLTRFNNAWIFAGIS